jgi:hypothetical protein
MCCGRNSTRISTAGGRAPAPRPPAPPRQVVAHSVAFFQYLGHQGLTVQAPRTGRRYRFDRAGAIVAVDPRDMQSLALVPSLRQVRSP